MSEKKPLFEKRPRTHRKREEFSDPKAPQWTEENAAHVGLTPKISESKRALFEKCATHSGDARQALELAIDLLAEDDTPFSKKDNLGKIGTRISHEKRDKFNTAAEDAPSKRFALERAVDLLAEHLGIDCE